MGSQCLPSLLSSVSLPSTLPASPLQWCPCAIKLYQGRRGSKHSCSQLKQAAPERGDTPPGERGLKLCHSKTFPQKPTMSQTWLRAFSECVSSELELDKSLSEMHQQQKVRIMGYRWNDSNVANEKTAKTDPVWWMGKIDTVTLYEQRDTTAMAWRIQWN